MLEPARLHAAEASVSDDADGDGLLDQLELKLGTSVDEFDSDGDGYSDAEEVARGSHPTRLQSIPAAGEVALNIEAYQDANAIHAFTAVYFADGDLRSRAFSVGLLVGDQMASKPLESFRGTREIAVIAGKRPGSKIVLLDPVVPTCVVEQTGSFSFFATLAAGGQFVAADALNLYIVDGLIFEHVVVAFHGNGQAPEVAVGMGIGGVYQPLGSGSGSQPNNVTDGEICAQTTVIVGVTGAVITQEVVAAECVPGWNAYCSRGCDNTVGATQKIIDPATLIGG